MANSPASNRRLVISADFAELVDRAGHFFADCADEAVAARGRFRVALSGGSTPKGLHRVLAGETQDASLRARVKSIPWGQTEIYFGDERYVPRDHPDSNYRMAKETLLDLVPIPPDQVHPMPTFFEDPQAAADAYTQTLRHNLEPAANDFPALDLILLGMGGDGHTASLFPGTAAVHEDLRWVVAHFVPKLSAERITLTPPVLCAAHHVAFLVSGSDKAEVLPKVLQGPYLPDEYPSQVIEPHHGTLTWFLDRAAAADLTK